MSLWRSYRGLSSRARLGVGLGLLAWGAAGMFLVDRAEEKFGFVPTEADRKELERMTPKIITVGRGKRPDE